MEYQTNSIHSIEGNHGDEDHVLLQSVPVINIVDSSPPGSPSRAAVSYLESAGLLDDSFAEESSPLDQTWPCWSDHPVTQRLSPDTQTGWLPPDAEPAPTSGRGELLEEKLTDALCQHAHRETKGFLPLDKLHKLVIESTVAETLTSCVPTLSAPDARSYARTICPTSTARSDSQPSFRRVFAILLMIQQPKEIFTFINNNIADHELPLVKSRSGNRGSYSLRRRGQAHVPLECLQQWSSFLVNSFDEYQWTVLSPLFSRGNKGSVRFYPLDDQTILPFIEDSSREADMEDDEDFQGGHGSVSRVKIHPSHHDFHDIPEAYESDSTFAVKRLHSRNREMFAREVDALKRLSGQNHIVPLLATFEHKSSFHLLFPWANANLRRYWAMFPNPWTDKRYGLWVARQCKGMARGLSIIHEPPYDGNHDFSHQNVLQPSHSRDPERNKVYGRHGDIKAENILWFKAGPNSELGILEIADFGLTRFHQKQSRSKISPVGMGNSPTYRAPEFDMPDGLLSRSYDIWALGCLYLEFITWYFLGMDGVTQFSSLRETKRNDLAADDCYFELSGSRTTGNICSKVKPSVTRWIGALRHHESCSPFFHDFLGIIERSMLVVETNCENPVRRATAAEVEQDIVQFCNRCGYDTAYLAGSNPMQDVLTTEMFPQVFRPEILPLREINGSIMLSELVRPISGLPTVPTRGLGYHVTLPTIPKTAPDITCSGTNDSDSGAPSFSEILHQNRRESISSILDAQIARSTRNCSRHTSVTQITMETNLDDSNSGGYFACPFYQRNRSNHWKTCSRGWEHIHRLKEHLYRRHLLPKYRCTRCLHYFSSAVDLAEHTRSITPCNLRECFDAEGITPDQERQLRSRKRKGTSASSDGSDFERWGDIYKIIFPGAEQHELPSPYYDHRNSLTSNSSETIAEYNEFLNRGIPSDVQTELEATIRRELGITEVGGRKIVDMIPMLQQRLFQSFHDYKETSAAFPISSQATQPVSDWATYGEPEPMTDL